MTVIDGYILLKYLRMQLERKTLVEDMIFTQLLQ